MTAMNRTTGIRMTAWLGILAVCLAMLMPGVNALKNRYQASGNSIFMADICYGAQADQAPALALDNAERPVLLTDSTQVGADVAGVVLTPAHVAHGGMPLLSDSPILAMLMPGVNALKNRYQASGNSIFMADICYGAQADQAPALALDNAERPVLLTDSTQVGADVAGVVLTPAHVAHGGMPILSDS